MLGLFWHLLGSESRGVLSVTRGSVPSPSPLSYPLPPCPSLSAFVSALPPFPSSSLSSLGALCNWTLCFRLSALCSLSSLSQLGEAVDLKGIHISGVWGAVEVGRGLPACPAMTPTIIHSDHSYL